MTTTAILAIAMLSIAILVLAWLLIGGGGISRRRARELLRRGLEATPTTGRANQRRRGFSELAASLYPAPARSYLERLIVRAGRPVPWPVERVVAAKIVLLIAMGGLGLFYVTLVRTPLAAGLGIFLALLGFFFPDLRLYSVGVERRQAISLQLPDTLDQMSIAVQAGLGFDAAMIRVARNGKGALAGEMIRAMQDIQVGQPRRVAYADLGERCGVPELRRFMRAIVQAETYGLALADVLHTQADEMRVQRRQRAEMKAMEIPVKVVFPLILCIMPAMFIVLVGPAGIRIAEALAQLNG